MGENCFCHLISHVISFHSLFQLYLQFSTVLIMVRARDSIYYIRFVVSVMERVRVLKIRFRLSLKTRKRQRSRDRHGARFSDTRPTLYRLLQILYCVHFIRACILAVVSNTVVRVGHIVGVLFYFIILLFVFNFFHNYFFTQYDMILITLLRYLSSDVCEIQPVKYGSYSLESTNQGRGTENEDVSCFFFLIYLSLCF